MGYCWPCMTLQGAVYFSSSAHICVGIFMTGYLIYYHVQSITHYYTNGVATTTATDGFFTICFIYAIVILIMGLCIFAGLEKKSIRLMKYTALAFAVLHFVIFLRVIYVLVSELVLSITNSDMSSAFVKGKSEFGFVFFTFLFFTTVIYLAILTMYIKDLQAANSTGNIFSQIQLGTGGGDGNPLYAYNTVHCHP